ncbi:MAG: phospholipase D-like domain-containing protein [Candidatus Bipolaricaulota bacterium]|nr:phospholipase D-like domain-containing protein [Candidatus Bipolaricaulota bacterium]MCS7275390.1 phospholipase D-like domain-containing protein [Candidatus Bipolaricaulota bacterium]MDW8110111.1 phospholipase D-like domain-containing protein [Candidatus Bipolaricaulota bacterium]
MRRSFWVGVLVFSVGFWGISLGPAQLPSAALRVYFTNPLAGLPLMNRWDAQANGVDRALIALIDSARQTIDIALYRLTMESVIEALARVCGRGVRVRIVSENEEALSNESAYQRLHALPCVALRTDALADQRHGRFPPLMHHKFAVFDRKTVWTGSLNWSERELYYDANNIIVLDDTRLAQIYTQEFEEMFERGRFSDDKYGGRVFTRLSTYDLGGARVGVYFTPSGAPQKIVLDAIQQAKRTIQIAMFAFTDDLIMKALAEARARGVQVEAVWDYRGWERFEDSEIDDALSLGIGVVDALPGLVHHKFAIIDGQTVITGSTNWSDSGFFKNDENLVVIESAAIANQFAQHFNALKEDTLKYDRDPTQPPRVTVRHYNTEDVLVRVEWRPHLDAPIDSYELCRATASGGPCEKIIERIPRYHRYYIDETAVEGRSYYYRMRARSGPNTTAWSNEFVTIAQMPSCPLVGVESECDCDDQLDNDGDRSIDCADLDCKAKTKCLGPSWRVAQGERVVVGVTPKEALESERQRYLGKLVTTEFVVANVREESALFRIQSHSDFRQSLSVIIFKSQAQRFRSVGIELPGAYRSKRIRVTGEFSEFNGQPQIVARSPWQIEIVGE